MAPVLYLSATHSDSVVRGDFAGGIEDHLDPITEEAVDIVQNRTSLL